MRTVLHLLSLMALCFMPLSCFDLWGPPTPEQYYPLKPGMTVISHTDIETREGGVVIDKKTSRNRLVNLPETELEGKKVFLRESTILDQKPKIVIKIFYGLAPNKDIYNHATQVIIDDQEKKIMVHQEPWYVLKSPLRPGAAWEQTVFSSLRPGIKIKVKTMIESLKEKVTVPAGAFDRCLLVTRKGTLTLENGGTVTKDQSYWYAPDLGLVKLIDKETLQEKGIVKVKTLTTQLETVESRQ